MYDFDELSLEPKLYLVEGDSSLLKKFTSYLAVKEAPAVVIDGGNSFDSFRVHDFCEKLNMDKMEKIFVSRAFTVFQLEKSILHKLPLFLEKHKVSLVIVSLFSDLFHSDDVEEEILSFLHRKLLYRLKEMTKRFNIPILVTERPQARMLDVLFDHRISFRIKGCTLFFSMNERKLQIPLIPPHQKTLESWGGHNG